MNTLIFLTALTLELAIISVSGWIVLRPPC